MDRVGVAQCLLPDDFVTSIGTKEQAIPIQTAKFAIHTLGQKRAIGTP
jgi:hypothetical protein